MHTLGRNEADVVAAAQIGDRDALNELVSAYLPTIYTLVRRALIAQADVDDVVQDTMVRAVRDLASLRAPGSFRPWLVAIALRQIATHQGRADAQFARSEPLDEATADLIAGGDVQDAAVTRVELSRQRRQVVRASQWLDPDDRAVLSLWWLESSGNLTRAELADALGVSLAHAGVRVQRMRDQLGLCRSIVVSLDRRPRCAELEGVLPGWDGAPGSVWRKRIARHVRACPTCGRDEAELVSPENLLIPFALLPVPFAVAAAVLGKSAAGAAAVSVASGAGASAIGGITIGGGAISGGAAKVGVLGHVTSFVAAHPVAVAVATAVVVTGTAVSAANLPASPPGDGRVAAAEHRPSVSADAPDIAAGSPGSSRTTSAPATTTRSVSTKAAGTVAVIAPGPVSLESMDAPGQFATAVEDLIFLRRPTQRATREAATFDAVRGLADPDCFSFRTADGRYLRHASWRFRANENVGTALFRGDATFCVRTGGIAGSIALEAQNYPGWFLHRRDDALWVDQSDGTDAFLAESSFRARGPLS